MFVLSAAGFIATRTSGSSPGVWMSVELKLIWNPRHARQRAGRRADLGREVRQGADVVAEDGGGPRELGPGQLHPVAGIAGEADGDPLELLDRRARAPSWWWSRAFRLLHALVRPGREVEQLLRERLGQVLDDVRLADDADEAARRRRRAARCDSGRSASGRSRHGSSDRGRACCGSVVMSDSTGWLRSTVAADDPAEDVALGQDADETAVRRRTRRPNCPSRSAGSRAGTRPGTCPAATVTGWRRLRTRRRSSRIAGTRRTTAASVRSVTLKV